VRWGARILEIGFAYAVLGSYATLAALNARWIVNNEDQCQLSQVRGEGLLPAWQVSDARL